MSLETSAWVRKNDEKSLSLDNLVNVSSSSSVRSTVVMVPLKVLLSTHYQHLEECAGGCWWSKNIKVTVPKSYCFPLKCITFFPLKCNYGFLKRLEQKRISALILLIMAGKPKISFIYVM